MLAAFSTSAEMLIAARALLGVAGATLAPSTLSLIRNMFHDPRQRTFAIGVWITSFSAGAAIGPLVGGLLLEHFWWGSVFLLGVPVMVLLLVVGPRLLPEYRDPDAGRLDLISAALSLLAVLAVIYGLKQIAQDGLGWIAGAVDRRRARRRRRVRAPAAEAGRSADRPAAVPGAAFSAALGGQHVRLLRQLRHRRLHRPVPAAGASGCRRSRRGSGRCPTPARSSSARMLTPLFVRRIRPAFVMAGGLALAAVGFALLTQVDGDSALAILVTGSVVFALGLAPVLHAGDRPDGRGRPAGAGRRGRRRSRRRAPSSAVRSASRSSAPSARPSTAAEIDDAVPAGVPPEAAEAARDTLGGAVAAGDELPGRLAAELVDAAREAFTQALQVAAGLSAAVAIGAAVLAAAQLRRVRVDSGLEEERGLEPERALASGCRPC